jgi:hypothetical protein
VLALVRGGVGGPELLERVEGLVEAGAAFGHRDADGLVLLG